MNNRKSKIESSTYRNSFGPIPQQMTLFPEEKYGSNLEKMKIRTLLKAFYKTEDNVVAVEQTD